MLRIGMLTSGGDCQALNPAMRGVAKALYEQNREVEIYGFEDGYKGLIYGNYRKLSPEEFSGILTEGGSYRPLKNGIRQGNGLPFLPSQREQFPKRMQRSAKRNGRKNRKTANIHRFPMSLQMRF